MNLPAITATDVYKVDHRRQYPGWDENSRTSKTSKVYSTWTPRSFKRMQSVLGFEPLDCVVYGNYLAFSTLVEMFDETFFAKSVDTVAHRYARRINAILGPNKVGVEHIVALHNLGYLPLQVKSLPEGMRVPARVATMTVTNTIPEFFWLVNYIETPLSNLAWKSATCATIAAEFRDLMEYYAHITGSPKDLIDFQVHDFSCRGMSGPEDAARSGTAHLLFFKGTDSMGALDQIEHTYGDNVDNYLIGASVAATEHSVMCMGGKESEKETFERLLKLYPEGIVSIVSDTWNYWEVITKLAKELKTQIMARDGKLVFRPDSGNPIHILAGYRTQEITRKDLNDRGIITVDIHESTEVIQLEGHYFLFNQETLALGKEIREEEAKGSVETLWDIFGGTENPGGYKFLDSHVGIIYGDSITIPRASEILDRLTVKGFGSTNVVFGVGSYTYQYLTRDSLGFAMKATYGEIEDEKLEILKDPITDDGTKKSATGLVKVDIGVNGLVTMYDKVSELEEQGGLLQLIFKDGEFYNEPSFLDIRNRATAA